MPQLPYLLKLMTPIDTRTLSNRMPPSAPGLQRQRRLLAGLFFLFALVPSWLLAAEGRFGMHGMVLFGGQDGLYASHLPMFHAPHDVQVVLKLRFADATLDRAMRARLDGTTALWTLAPERFALDRLAPGADRPLADFAADVVEGHFEQGGVVRHRQARVAVEQVILYRQLDGAPSVRMTSRYVPVGRFLVKLIDSRPDLDHIVLLAHPAPAQFEVAKTGMHADLAALAAHATPIGSVYGGTEDLR